MSTANVNEYMSKLSSLFNWAVKEELADRNPARGLRLADRLAANEKRFPFSIWQLCKIFNAPLYTGCRDDKNGYAIIGGNQPRRSRFWIPLVALYSGLRQGEICQLLTRDVRVIDGILCFVVSASSADGKSLKTAASTRIVPVHPELERVGFGIYLRDRQAGGDYRLFPELSGDSLGMPSGKFSKWFTRFLVSCGANADRTCFHSFRHCFRDALREAEVPREVALTLGGWATSGPSGLGAVADAYGSGYSAKLLSTGLSSISFSGLDLSHLYEAI